MNPVETIEKITEQKQILLDGYQQLLLLPNLPASAFDIIKSTLKKHNEQ
jgi:hypothetical protein